MKPVFNRTNPGQIDISCQTDADMKLGTEQLFSVLRPRHRLRPLFNVRSQALVLEGSRESSRVMTTLLGGIALFSFIVGGIGIMNIMLVSVTERTSEVRIRKAPRGTVRQIMVQFFVEAVVITVIKGVIGTVPGAVAAQVMGHVLKPKMFVQPASVPLTVVVSSSVGIFLGLYPARRAGRSHPVDALRYE